jgi:hypothetical protein
MDILSMMSLIRDPTGSRQQGDYPRLGLNAADGDYFDR